MSSDTAITVRDLSKCYLIYDRPQDRLKQSIFRNRQYFREFWALKDVSFDIKKGETVGIIGRNGSGKSTLLQIIAGILSPTSGEVEVSGRVAALLELGSGFNPEFTGRENVFMNGAILGISREDMEHRFDEIAAFADIGEFIEQPVKTYSSGMIVRLAFSVAINVNADILIVDEALSVGDMRFQAKCIERIKLFQKKGGTILLVSHNLVMIRTTCTGCIWIEDSKIREMGPVDAITSNYEFYVMRSENTAPESNSYCDNNGDVIISGVNILNSEGNKTEKFTTGDDVRLLIELNNRLNYPKDISLGVAIHKENGLELSRINTSRDDCKYFLNPGENTIELCLFSIDLLTGSYYISIFVGESNMRYTISKHEFVASFYIETPFSLMGMRLYDGLFRFKHNWLIK